MIAEARAAGLLLVAATALLFAGLASVPEVFFDFGPNDSHYVRGFREDFEIDEPTLIHWTRTRSTVRLPVHLRGPYEVRLRYKRHIAAPAEVRFFLGGEHVDTRVVPQRDFEVLTLRSPGTTGTFDLAIASSSSDPRPLGIALDWMQIVPERRTFPVLPSAASFLFMLSWPLFFYAAARVLRFSRRIAFVVGTVTAAGLALALFAHALWPIYATEALGLRFLLITASIVAASRVAARRQDGTFASDEAKWAVLVVVAGMTLRLFLLFHPDFYYPDVRTHSKFVSLIWTEGMSGFFSDFIPNQHRHLLGLQYVGDRWLAFPYPPLLYLTIYPLSRLQLPVEEWMKVLPTALLAVEALLLFAVARRLGLSRRAGLVAVTLHATAGVLGFRLAVASFAALFGHFWDVVVVVYLVFFLDRMGELRYGLGLYALVTLSLMSYAGSALVLGFLMPLLAIVLAAQKTSPKRCLAIAGWSLAAAGTAFALFYAQYIPELFGGGGGGAGVGDAASAAPSGLAFGTELVDPSLTPMAALRMSAYRLRLFYGLLFSVIAAAGLAVLARPRSRVQGLAKALAFGTAGTYLGLNFLRAGLGDTHIFQFSKDDLVVTALVVFILGALVDRLLSMRGAARLLGAGLVLLWVAWGLQLFAREIRGRFIRPQYVQASAAVSVSGGVDDAVAARPLGSVERSVGELEQLDVVVGLER